MKIELNTLTMFSRLGDQFSLSACEVICKICSEADVVKKFQDIRWKFKEVPMEGIDNWECSGSIKLRNGNILLIV